MTMRSQEKSVAKLNLARRVPCGRGKHVSNGGKPLNHSTEAFFSIVRPIGPYVAGTTLNRCVARSGRAYMAALIVTAGLVAFVANEAEAQRGRGFDAVGGGASSAMSFAQSGGVAWRIYPPGGRAGFEAGAKFQSYSVSPLVQRMEGMEGNIWGENLWRAQENQNAKRELARAEGMGKGAEVPPNAGDINGNLSATTAMRGAGGAHNARSGRTTGVTRQANDRLAAENPPQIASKDSAVAAALSAASKRKTSKSNANKAEEEGQPWWTGAR